MIHLLLLELDQNGILNLRQILIILIFYFPLILLSQETPEQIEYWENLIKQNPNTALNYFNLGVILQKQNQLKKAVINYNKVIELKSKLTPMAIYYKAQAYESVGNIPKAKELIKEISLENIPDKMKQTILNYKNKLFASDVDISLLQQEPSDNKPDQRLFLYIEYSSGTNSNPASSSNSSTSITKDTQSLLKAGVDVLIDYSSFYDIKIEDFYSQTTFKDQQTLNYKYNDLTLPISFYFDSYKLKLTPEYFSDYDQTTFFSDQKGASAELTYKSTDTYYNFLIQTNRILNKTTTYDYLSGYQNKFSFGVDQKWSTSKASSKVYFSDYHYVDTSTLVSSYKSYGLNLSYSAFLENFDFSVSGVFEYRIFAKALTDNLARQDQRTYLDLQIGYTFLNSFRLFADANTNTNQSNFNSATNDKNTKQTIFLGGLSASY